MMRNYLSLPIPARLMGDLRKEILFLVTNVRFIFIFGFLLEFVTHLKHFAVQEVLRALGEHGPNLDDSGNPKSAETQTLDEQNKAQIWVDQRTVKLKPTVGQ
jgi:hypothetical protein